MHDEICKDTARWSPARVAGSGARWPKRWPARGAKVVMVAREAGPLADAVATIRARGGDRARDRRPTSATRTPCTRSPGRRTASSATSALAIHNASTLGPTPLRLLLDTECEDLAAVLATNLVGPFRLTKVARGRDGAARRRRDRSRQLRRGGRAVPALGRVRRVEGGAGSPQPHPRARSSRAPACGSLAVDPGEMDTAMHAAAMPDADRATLRAPPTSPRRSST